MELFEKFNYTIFLKEYSNLEKQIEELEQIKDDVPDFYKDKVIYDKRMLEKGLEGEKEIAFELKNADIGMFVLHDIKLNYKDLNAQFDYIVITKGFVYLIECKNFNRR